MYHYLTSLVVIPCYQLSTFYHLLLFIKLYDLFITPKLIQSKIVTKNKNGLYSSEVHFSWTHILGNSAKLCYKSYNKYCNLRNDKKFFRTMQWNKQVQLNLINNMKICRPY